MFLIFMLILIVIIVVFAFLQRSYTKATMFMMFMVTSYLFVVLTVIIYMSKDAYHYNSLYKYFGITQTIQNQLVFLPISRYSLVRIMNFFTLSFLYTGLCSAIFFSMNIEKKKEKWLLLLLTVPAIIQFVLYDPSVYTGLYYRFYSPEFVAAYDWFHRITLVINTAYIVAGLFLFIYAFFDAPKVRLIRSNILMILICYVSIQVTYYYMQYWAPNVLIIVSKAAHFTRFKPINLAGKPSMYTLLPYISAFCLILCLYGIYKYARIQNRIKNRDSLISRNIDSAVVTSRVFSHYIKNEMLALIAQSEFLQDMCKDQAEVRQEIQVIEHRCRNLYGRLDAIHQKNLKSKMDLKPVALSSLVENLLEEMHLQLKDIHVDFSKSKQQPLVMADSFYLSQGVENIVSNAVDALENIPDKIRRIHIEINIKNKWVELVIRDNGAGIPEKYLHQIFEPFFSSKPTSKNWGMGLSLCHNIITAHEGKVAVESTEGEGTAFRMVIPLLAIINNEPGD